MAMRLPAEDEAHNIRSFIGGQVKHGAPYERVLLDIGIENRGSVGVILGDTEVVSEESPADLRMSRSMKISDSRDATVTFMLNHLCLDGAPIVLAGTWSRSGDPYASSIPCSFVVVEGSDMAPDGEVLLYLLGSNRSRFDVERLLMEEREYPAIVCLSAITSDEFGSFSPGGRVPSGLISSIYRRASSVLVGAHDGETKVFWRAEAIPQGRRER